MSGKWYRVVALLCAVLALPATAFALEGPLDGSQHPSVGNIFGQQTDPSTCHAEIIGPCSATLLSSTVLVTTGSCADQFLHPEEYGYTLTAIWISFNPDNSFDCSSAIRVASIAEHPLFDEMVLDSPYNIGVFTLASPAAGTPATLPAAGALDALVHGADLEVAEYGPDHNGNVLTQRRRLAAARLASQDADLQKLHLGGGNQCFNNGLEGGAAFFPSSQNLASLSLGLASGCKSGQLLRLDTSTARDFLDDFVTVP